MLIKGLGLGGAERLLSQSIPFLDRAAFDYELAFFTPWKDDVVPDFEEAGIPVTCLDITRDTSLAAIKRLSDHLRSGGYDLVHTHSPYPSALARVLLAGRSGTRLIHTEHSLSASRKPLTRIANRLTYPFCDVVVSVSREVNKTVEGGWPGPRATRVIHGGIDEAAISPAHRSATREALGASDRSRIVGNVAHLRSQKGHATFLEAAARVAEEIPDALFVIVGREKEPGYQDELAKMADELGIGDRVHFTGFQPDPYPFMASFDLFLMASDYEGFPIALVEAMAMGLPIVATDVGGVGEAIRDGVDGLLTPPGDADTLARHAVDLLQQPDHAAELAGRARERALEEFTLAAMVRRTEDLYREVLGDAPANGR